MDEAVSYVAPPELQVLRDGRVLGADGDSFAGLRGGRGGVDKQ